MTGELWLVIGAAVLCAAVLLLAGYAAGSGRRPRTASSRRLLEDASNRALRTFLQGLALDVLVAGALVVHEATGGDGPLDWRLLAASLLRTVAQSAAAYVMRRYLDPSRVPTPLPPSRPG